MVKFSVLSVTATIYTKNEFLFTYYDNLSKTFIIIIQIFKGPFIYNAIELRGAGGTCKSYRQTKIGLNKSERLSVRVKHGNLHSF